MADSKAFKSHDVHTSVDNFDDLIPDESDESIHSPTLPKFKQSSKTMRLRVTLF